MTGGTLCIRAVLTPQKAHQRFDLYVKTPRRWQVATGIFAWIRRD
jgi:hypothetical protein